jgi:hypothetical protein
MIGHGSRFLGHEFGGIEWVASTEYPVLKYSVIPRPGGNPTALMMDLARAVHERCERTVRGKAVTVITQLHRDDSPLTPTSNTPTAPGAALG